MADKKEKLFSDFSPVSTEQWMEKVTADLKGADFEKKLVWKTGDRHGYALHPPGKPDRAGGRNQGPEARGNGTLEADSTGGGQRFLPPPGVSRA